MPWPENQAAKLLASGLIISNTEYASHINASQVISLPAGFQLTFPWSGEWTMQYRWAPVWHPYPNPPAALYIAPSPIKIKLSTTAVYKTHCRHGEQEVEVNKCTYQRDKHAHTYDSHFATASPAVAIINNSTSANAGRANLLRWCTGFKRMYGCFGHHDLPAGTLLFNNDECLGWKFIEIGFVKLMPLWKFPLYCSVSSLI